MNTVSGSKNGPTPTTDGLSDSNRPLDEADPTISDRLQFSFTGTDTSSTIEDTVSDGSKSSSEDLSFTPLTPRPRCIPLPEVDVVNTASEIEGELEADNDTRLDEVPDVPTASSQSADDVEALPETMDTSDQGSVF